MLAPSSYPIHRFSGTLAITSCRDVYGGGQRTGCFISTRFYAGPTMRER